MPYPEVVDFETNDDGSVTLTVNAVYPNENTSKLFSHRVTVSDKDGQIYYLSNEIFDDEESALWWHADRLSEDEWDKYYKDSNCDEDDYSWMLPQIDHEIFTAEEKKQIEEETLMNVTEIWGLYEGVTIDESLTSLSSQIVDFTKEQRIEVLDALGELGVIAVTDDANTYNGESLKQFYDFFTEMKKSKAIMWKLGLIKKDSLVFR